MGSSVSIGLPDVSEAIEQTSELLEDKEKLRELWLRVDENKNGFITLSEFSKMIAAADGDDSPVFSDFDNPKAIERAYFSTCGGGKTDEWVERREFPALLRNVIYFDKLWDFFESVDTDNNRKITYEEFQTGIAKLELKGVATSVAERHFQKIDTSRNNEVEFDEWVKYFAATFHPLANDFDAQVFDWKTSLSPRKMIHRKRKTKNADGRRTLTDSANQISRREASFNAVEAAFKELITESDEMRALWDSLDYKCTGTVSLDTLFKFFEQDPEFEVLNCRPALVRAYKRTTLQKRTFVTTASSDELEVRWREFPALLRNAIVFNRLWRAFDDVDLSEDRSIDFTQFCRGCSQLGLKMDVAQCEVAFDDIDSNDNGAVLFDEFCVWYGKDRIPVK